MRSFKLAATVIGIFAILAATSVYVIEGVAAESETADSSPMTNGEEGSIWVTGEGKIEVKPNVAVLRLGVEAREATVIASRAKAAAALDAINSVLDANGIARSDVQTSRFSIYPQYDWRVVTEGDVSTEKQVLLGFRVNNNLTVKARNLDALGILIDEIVFAGGDATRFNGIDFQAEDTSSLMSKLREKAVQDAREKAQHFAELSEVELGRMIFLSEPGAFRPGAFGGNYESVVTEAAAFARATTISSGAIEISLQVNVGYAIK